MKPASISYYARPPRDCTRIGAWCTIGRYQTDGTVEHRNHYHLTDASQSRLAMHANIMGLDTGAVILVGTNGWSVYP